MNFLLKGARFTNKVPLRTPQILLSHVVKTLNTLLRPKCNIFCAACRTFVDVFAPNFYTSHNFFTILAEKDDPN